MNAHPDNFDFETGGVLPTKKQAVHRPISYLPRLPKTWEAMTADEQKAFTTAFTTAKLEMQYWVQRDPDPRMNSDTIRVVLYLLHSVNMKSLQCNPSQKTIAEELNMTRRTVERCIARAIAAGWVAAARFDRNMSNWYLMVENAEKAKAIDDRIDFLRQARADERAEVKQAVAKRITGFDPSVVAVRTISDPSVVAVPDPSGVADKHLSGTLEDSLYEGERPLRTSTVPSYEEIEDDPHLPYPTPEGEQELASMLSQLFAGCQLSPPIMSAMRKMLMAGKLTPAIVEEQRRFAS